MKCQTKCIIEIAFTLDSSEMLMFTKGGKHSFEVSHVLLDEISEISIENKKVIISVQMERNQQDRFDFVTNHPENK